MTKQKNSTTEKYNSFGFICFFVQWYIKIHHVPNEKCGYILKNMIRGCLNKFPDLFRMGTFIDSTHMKL